MITEIATAGFLVTADYRRRDDFDKALAAAKAGPIDREARGTVYYFAGDRSQASDVGEVVDWSEAGELVLDGGTYEMANVRPEKTGLPFVVFISQRGNARHDARVKVSYQPVTSRFVASVAIRDGRITNGTLQPSELRALQKWLDLNRDVLMKLWDGEIAYHDDAVEQLTRLEEE
jgi:hypothetical protein